MGIAKFKIMPAKGRTRLAPSSLGKHSRYSSSLTRMNKSDISGLAPGGLEMSNFIALVVEDDAFQREALTELLRSEGLEVVECATGAVAELVLVSTGTELRALVTDVELGEGMSGLELAQYAKIQFPNLNVVIVSGRDPPYLPQDACFLMKPYRARELLDAVLR
jgi:CheY-like chemotaxis protein